MRVKSATFDEDAYIGEGASILLEGNYWLRVVHPALAPMIGALPLLTESGLEYPIDHDCWPDGTARSCGRELLFYRSDTQRVLFLARLPTVFLLLLLTSTAFRWARELYGGAAGVVAAGLCALDPNLLAHGRLVTLDLLTTLVVFTSCYSFWRFWSRPTWWGLLQLGLVLGAAGATHFATGLLVPMFVAISIGLAWRPVQASDLPALGSAHRGRRMISAFAMLLLAGMVAGVVIWVIHGADFGPVPRWDGVRLPAPAYFNELAARLEQLSAPHGFLLGHHYEGGWWPYFVVAFLVKTPLPTILLLGFAVALLIQRRDGRLGDTVALLVAGQHYAYCILSELNRGYRYLLPMLPLLLVFASRVVRATWSERPAWLRYLSWLLLGWLVCANLAIYPHYLAYFNELVGPSNGYRVLVDSSLDWGQDLPALERYVAEQDVSEIYLSWFGESRPWQYEIPYRFIPSKPDELSDVYTRVYHPDYPLPGLYAISATNLQGVLFEDKDIFDWFRQREPVAQPGYSILVYEVPRLLDSAVPAVNVMLGGPQLDQVGPEAFEQLWHTNDLRLGWFAPATSCQLPGQGEVWLVTDAAVEPDSLQCPLMEQAEFVADLPVRGGDGRLNFARLDVDAAVMDGWIQALAAGSPLVMSDEISFQPGEASHLRQAVEPPLNFADRIDLLGYRVLTADPQPASSVELITYWRVTAADREPLAIFAQLLDESGSPRAGFDGLDVPPIGWLAGDVIVQAHTLSLPSDLEPGRYWLQLGMYHVQGVRRLPVLLEGAEAGNRVLLPPLEIR